MLPRHRRGSNVGVHAVAATGKWCKIIFVTLEGLVSTFFRLDEKTLGRTSHSMRPNLKTPIPAQNSCLNALYIVY